MLPGLPLPVQGLAARALALWPRPSVTRLSRPAWPQRPPLLVPVPPAHVAVSPAALSSICGH